MTPNQEISKDNSIEKTQINNAAAKGYSFHELQYQRALIAVKKDFCATSFVNELNKIKNRKLFFNGKEMTSKNTWLSKVLSGLNYFDYAMLAASTFSSVKKVFRIFKRKK